MIELVSILWGDKWRIVATALALGLLGFGVASVMKPVYRAEVLVALVSDRSGGGGLAGLAGQFGGLASIVGIDLSAGGGSEAMGILRSRALAERFMGSMNLVDVLSDEKADHSDPASMEVAAGKAYERFNEKIRSVMDDPESGLVKVRFDWLGRQEVAVWANEYVRLANQLARERAIAQAETRLQYLAGAVEEAPSIELRQALFNLIESEAKSRMLASVDDEISFRVVDPAVTPTVDEIERPRKILVAGVSFIAGLFIAIAVSYIVGVFRKRSPASPVE